MIAAEAMPGGAVTLSGRGMVHSGGRLVETGNAGGGGSDPAWRVATHQ